MKNITELHLENVELVSESQFLMHEINFFLKLMKKSYDHAKDRERVKILDAYWKEFESYKKTLNDLIVSVRDKEKDLSMLLMDDLADTEKTKLKDGLEIATYYKVLKGIRLLKERFYNFMSQYPGECSCH